MKHKFNKKLLIVFKLIVILIVITFVWFHLRITSQDFNQESDQSFNDKTRVKVTISTNKLSHLSNTLSLKQLKTQIEDINRKQEVFNYHIFGPLLSHHLVIVIQVHNRTQYLLSLIESLKQTKHINNVLLIFSHDVFNEEINSLISSINFCKVIQVFYPKSLQLHPNSFPGQSDNDCPRDVSYEDAVKIGCINRLSADTFGHYREAKYSQTKHHFWWKINIIFDLLNITRHHLGNFMFLEEDHYLAPDALHVWKLMNEYRNKNCPQCQVITLGSYTHSYNYKQNGYKISISKWISSQHNMAFIINRNVWNLIKMCAKTFCTYDDYNWDWSLQYVSEKCLKSPLKTLYVLIPRVYHTGECGLHHNKQNCNNKQVIQKIKQLLKTNGNYLFPKQMVLYEKSQFYPKIKVNGGWADPRDHQLCLNHTFYSQ
ncbi:alpha-1,6-mannosyl-glycoprotein 2-beta-N-acetylglucosaminyltransferase-like [Oppia nitens]|uniref:alpha-1,6-mannosyl-glycoprotein 2-beta-N-acetylglucosaminyltransferase-like n=1 Tax=Oppia nitens TaxID=1686743 RepID=UPI0023DA37A2|nr:alpha-1,6-mannosyl-glycoprotein 2-beta-N-acetylglucosaminyltransferase-like [Oppia nitens]